MPTTLSMGYVPAGIPFDLTTSHSTISLRKKEVLVNNI